MNINAAGSLSPTLVTRCEKGRKAIFALNRRFSIKKLPIEIALKLFDSYINPILLYGLDIWMPFHSVDFNKWDHTEIESVHLQFCKHILGVNRSTSNIFVRGELGRYPLKEAIDTRIIQTYKHFFNSKYDLVYQALQIDKDMYEQQLLNTFTSYVKFIDRSGNHTNPKAMDTLGKHKIRKLLQTYYNEIWNRKILTNPKANFIKYFKTNMNFEKYLIQIEDRKLRIPLTKFRLSDHELNIETGRHRNIPRNERHCPLCKAKVVEDEAPALLVCEQYNSLRTTFFNKTGNTNETNSLSKIEKMQLIFNSNDQRNNLYIANYIRKITEERYILTKFTW